MYFICCRSTGRHPVHHRRSNWRSGAGPTHVTSGPLDLLVLQVSYDDIVNASEHSYGSIHNKGPFILFTLSYGKHQGIANVIVPCEWTLKLCYVNEVCEAIHIKGHQSECGVAFAQCEQTLRHTIVNNWGYLSFVMVRISCFPFESTENYGFL